MAAVSVSAAAVVVLSVAAGRVAVAGVRRVIAPVECVWSIAVAGVVVIAAVSVGPRRITVAVVIGIHGLPGVPVSCGRGTVPPIVRLSRRAQTEQTTHNN